MKVSNDIIQYTTHKNKFDKSYVSSEFDGGSNTNTIDKVSKSQIVIFDIYKPFNEKEEIKGDDLKLLTKDQYEQMLKQHRNNKLEYDKNLKKYKCCRCDIF